MVIKVLLHLTSADNDLTSVVNDLASAVNIWPLCGGSTGTGAGTQSLSSQRRLFIGLPETPLDSRPGTCMAPFAQPSEPTLAAVKTPSG